MISGERHTRLNFCRNGLLSMQELGNEFPIISIEDGLDEERLGRPQAFNEIAW